MLPAPVRGIVWSVTGHVRRTFGSGLLGLLCVALAGCAAAGSGQGARPSSAVVAEVLDLSGAREGAQSLESALRRIVGALSGAGTFGDADVVRAVIEREITAERLFASIESHVGREYDRERFDRLIDLLRQPLVRRMTKLEIASTAVSPENVKAWHAANGATEEGRARLALGRRIDAAVEATTVTMEVLFAAGRGVVSALRVGLPPNRQLPPDFFRSDLAKLEPDTREETVISLAFTYREASLDELRRYAELLETDLARWFSRMQRDAAVQAAEALSERAMRRLIDLRRAPTVRAEPRPMYRFGVRTRVDIDARPRTNDRGARCWPTCSSPSPCWVS